MSVRFDLARERWVVRWREAGRQRERRFASEREAVAFDTQVASTRGAGALTAAPAGSAGVYAYETTAGTRRRFVFRQSDGLLTSRRGFTSRSAAMAARATVVEEVRRGNVRAT